MTAAGYLHPPASDFATRSLPIIEHGGPGMRIHRSEHGAIYFDTSDRFRFNAIDAAYGVLYCGESLECCLVETLFRLDARQTTIGRSVSQRELEERTLSRIQFTRSMRLVDLSGAGLALIGAHEALCSGPYDQVRPWSRALWKHPDVPDGLLFRARHNPSLLSIALFDRASPNVRAERAVPLLALPPAELAAVFDQHKIGLR